MGAVLIPPEVLYQGELLFTTIGLIFGLGFSLRIALIRAVVERWRG